MDSTDADMMDLESSAPPPPPSNPEHVDGVRGLLAFARQLVHQGKPSQALQAVAHPELISSKDVWFQLKAATYIHRFYDQVVMAMREEGGEEAVLQALSRAKESYRNKLQASSAADELASLFAECAIAEALPSSTPGPSQLTATPESFESNVHGTSILAETGRKQVMVDAFSDGSSFVCLQCGGLVSYQRRDEHNAFWCGHS